MRRIFAFTLFLALSYSALAQQSSCNGLETSCSDGIDNDGDGFIDCFDCDCANKSACDASYIGKDKACQDPPTQVLKFGMQLGAASADRTTLSYGRMAVGDLDRDGIPEMVTTHNNDKKVYILNGNDLSTKLVINTQGSPEYFDHAIANLDDDNCGEIFIVEYDVVGQDCYKDWRGRTHCNDIMGYYVTSYDCQGNLLWRTQAHDQPFTIGLADFDYDGNVELYYKNEILDAKTGEVLVQGAGDWNDYDSGPVAVDILDDSECTECAGLELVLGGEIYAVDLDPRTPGGGSLTLEKEFNNLPNRKGVVYHPKYVSFGYVNSMTSVADYNLDGYLDVIMGGATSKSATSTTTVFFWDVHNNKFKYFQPKQPKGDSWPHGTGRINLADIDGDGKMNATFVSGARIYALDENFDLKWQKTITEQTSGFTSTTVFDFNNDNAVEIVYRDEANLYIIDGKTGNAFTTVTCRSRTANDYPIVVDVDADGATEICVSCATDDNTDISDNNNTPYGQIRVFESSLEPWVSARKVWNQYAYFNVNVNDDLTIPQVQQKHHLVFSSDVCGKGDNRALNSFLNQSAILDSKGCKTYPSADVAFVANPSLLNITPPTCPDKDFLVSFSLKNIGDLDLNGDFPISFYNGDPRFAGAVKLSTIKVPLNNFKIGDQINVDSITVTGSGGAFTLFAVLNDNGSTVPTPIKLPNSGFDECNFSNNIVSASVNPKAFQLSTVSTDHVQCGAGPSPPNGTARVFKPEGATEQTVGYTFYWFKGATAGAPTSADFTGPLWNGLTDGTYTVFAKNDAYQCGSDTVQVTVGLQTRTISATVSVDKPFTNCKSPDGQLSVVPDGGAPLTNYKFEWFEGTVFGTSPTLSTSNVLEFTKALTYSVLVTEISSNCETLESGTVPDLTVKPAVTTAFLPANCAPPNSGQASATVGGATSGYTFKWYDGSTSKPTEDFLGDTYNNVTAGNYTVIAKDNTTGCSSDETVVTVPTVSGIAVTANVTAQQTSCATPNGAASANVGGTTSGFTFKWFEGNSTVTQIGTGPDITELAAGDYTVEATSVATGCTDTELITIVDDIQMPTVTASVVAQQTHCFPANGSVSAVAAGSPGPYNYYWFKGNVGTPDTTVADFKGAVYDGLAAGFYTVVAVDVNSRCGSARSLVEVLDQTSSPVIAATTSAQISCDPAVPNGQASANVGGSTAGYKFRWFSGADTTTFLTQSPAISGRAAGSYTVKAVNLVSGCYATKLVVINDISAKPVLSLTAIDNSVCSATVGYTGSVTAAFASNPNALPGDTYVYEWRRNGIVMTGETGASVSAVNAGTYEVVVTNQNLDCVSDPANIVVNDDVVLPAIATNSTASTNCAPGLENGSAEVVTVDTKAVGATTDYTYRWHTGSGTAAPIPIASNPTADDAVLSNVQGGTGYDYTVLVTNTLTGCENTAVVSVADAKVLPALSLAATDNSICDPALTSPSVAFNGTITATVTNQIGALTDYTFAFAGGAGTQGASPNHNTFNELNGGITYTATATHTLTGCVSTPATIQVLNNQDIPDLITSSTGSTNCVPGLEDGQARVVEVDNNPATTTGFTFAWTGPAAFDVSSEPTNDDIQLENVQGGAGYDYTVLVTNQSNGCQNTAVVNVADAKVLPALSLSATDNSICDPALTSPSVAFNGTITATVTNQIGALTDYTFAFAGGSGTQGASPNHNTFNELNGGITYTATATHTLTGCVSTPASIQVLNNQDIPDLITSSTGSTNCAPGFEDGQARVVEVDNNPATTTGFTFAWTGPAAFDVSSEPTNDDIQLENVQGGTGYDYTVLVTNQSNGCQNTAMVNVADAKVLPALSLAATDNSICDPALTSPSVAFNGTITATVTNQIGALTDYTFAFAGGAGTQGALPNHNTFNELNGGITYTATATHTLTGCMSTPATIQVLNNQDIPDLITSSTGSTNCAPGFEDGQARVVEVDNNPATTTGFTFAWTGPAAFDVSSEPTNDDIQLENVQGGAGYDYTVLVTNQSNGCQNTAVVNVADEKVLPALSLSATDNSICDPALTSPSVAFNGTITATVTNQIGALTDYTFAFAGGSGTQGASPNHNTFNELNGGITYTATATHTLTGCVSTPATIQVLNNQDIPDLITSSTGSTNCAPGFEDGQARVVEVDNNPATTTGFTFAWTGPAAFDVSSEPTNDDIQLENVQGGAGYDYTVLVTNQSNGCQNTAVVNVADAKVLPALSLSATDNSICDPALTSPSVAFNGTITATVTNQIGALTDYTFAFAGGTGTQGASPNHNTFNELNGGITYTATATHAPTGCVSAPATIQVLNSLDRPDLTMGSTASTNCAIGLEDGQARVVEVDSNPATTTGFTFEWTGPASPAFSVAANPTKNAIQLENVQGGAGYDYTVLVTNQSNGCQSTGVVNVADEREIPTLTLTPQPNTICDPSKATLGGGAFDGQVAAVIDAVGNYAGSVSGDFTFAWNTGLTGIGADLLDHVDVGSYSVTVTHTATGCQSTPHIAQVTSAKVLPAITMSSTPSQNCAGGAPDGIASVTNVLPNGKNYDYRWFDGNTASGVPAVTTLNTTSTTNDYTDVQGGVSGATLMEYTVEVTILQTGCVNTATVGVDDDSQVPVLGPLTPTDNTLCSVVKNGTATVSTLSYRGALIPTANYSDFTFTWSGGTQGPVETITQLAAGTYTLTVTNNDDKCQSNPVSVTIDDDLFLPQIDIASVDQTSCDPLAPNGSLTATVDEAAIGGPASQTVGYSFTWVDDVTSASTPLNAISNLKGNQNYTVTVVRDATACSNTQTVFLSETLTLPVATVTPTDLTICDPPNGALAATNLANHTYYWYNDNNAPTSAYVVANFDDNTSGESYTGLIPGDYTLVVQDNTTKCNSLPIIATVGNAAPGIAPTIADVVIPTDCNSAGDLTGGVQLTPAPNAFTADAATEALTMATPLVGVAVNDPVVISRDGSLALPPPLLSDRIYYIKSIAGNVITLSDTPGGAVINLTANGDGLIGDISTAGYTFEWYAGIPTATDPGLGSIDYFTNPPVYSGPALSITANLTSVASGLYTLQVTNTATGCRSYLPHTLPYIGSHAVLKIVKTNSTICPYTTGNGSIEIQIEDPPTAPPTVDQTSYEVTLISGATTVVPTFNPTDAVNPFMVSNALAPGSYSVEVRETYSGTVPGCVVSQDVIIGADALPPVISLASAVKSNSACDPAGYDGQIEISISKDPADKTAFPVTLDIEMTPDPNSAFPLNAQPLGAYTATNLGPDDYAFAVTAVETGCVASKTFTVLDDPAKSELLTGNIAITDAEYCDPNLEQSAKVVVNQVNMIGGGAENLADYQFDWFTDATLTTNIYSALGDPTATKGGEELSNAAPTAAQKVTNGTYWIVATKKTDLSGTGGLGCTSTPFSVNIKSKKIKPAITLTPGGDTSCDPTFFEGSIQVDVTTASGPGVPGLYDYTWAPTGAAGQPANSVGNSGAADMFNSINDGAYTLTAVNQLTGCSSTLTTTVTKAPPPVFTLAATATDLQSCGTFDGKIDGLQVFVDGAPGNLADFDYVWFRSDLLPASKVLDGQNAAVPVDVELTTATYPAIDVDKYFIKAIRKAGGAGMGCESSALRKDILDARVYPQLSFTTIPTTACDNNHDGQITVSATTASGPGAAANYNFEWTDDPDGLGNAAFSASNSPNNNTSSPFTTVNTDLIGAGSYSIRVTNFATQCFTDGTVEVTKKTIPMEIAGVTPTHVDMCTVPQNGAGTVTGVNVGGAAGNTADFTFTWAENAAMNSPLFTDDPALTQNPLDIGTYYVTAKRNAVVSPATPGVTGSGCVTAPVSFTVLDKRVTPTISFATVPTTACDNNHDGQITVTAITASGPGAAPGTGYNFVWTNDPDGLAGTAFQASNSPTAATLSPWTTLNTDLIGEGAYSIRVTNSVTQCFADGTVTVTKKTIPMAIAGVTPTHVDMCTVPQNGAGTITGITVNSAAGNTADFTFTWADNAAMALPLATDDPALTQNPLDIGTYYVTAKRNAVASPATPGVTGSGCVTAPVSFTVLDKRVTPTISFTTVPTTACDNNYDGQITVAATTASGPGAVPGTGYNFVWTDDPDGLANIAFQASNSPTATTLSPWTTLNTDLIGEGAYSIRVTNSVTQCFADGTVTVTKKTIPMAIAGVTPTHVDLCTLPQNGAGTITGITVNNAAGNTADFTFTWADNAAMTSPFATDDPGLAQNPLDIGKYYVTAKRNAVLSPATPGVTGSGCVTAPIAFEVLDKRVYPTISFATVSSTSCNNQYDGQITVTAETTGFAPATQYDFSWTSNPAGTTITDRTGVVSAAVFQSEALGGAAGERIGPGTYAITVTNTVSKCSSDGSVTLQQNTVPLAVATANATALTHCTVPDGTASVTVVNVNGAAAALTDFDFAWTGPGGSYAGTNLTGLSNGDYFVTATKTNVSSPASGCSTSPLKLTVLDNRKYPSISFATLASTACNNEYDGQITVTAETTGFAPGTQYDFDWTSNPAGTTITDRAGVVSAAVFQSEALGGAAGERIGPGTYNITVTNTVNQCTTGGSVTLQQNTVPLRVVTANATALTHCTVPDGTASVAVVNVNGAAGALTDFDFAWTGPGGSYTGTNLTGLSNGDYFVTATKTEASSPASGCSTSPLKITVLDNRKYPSISFATLASTACNNEYDGQITVTATTTGFGSGTLYDFDWTGNPAGTTITDRAGVVSDAVFQSEALGGAAGERIGPGTYNITVTNTANQCTADGSVTLQQNTVPVEILAASASPQQMCTVPGDGTVAVALTDIRVGGNPVGGGVTFAWEDTGGNAVGAGTSVTNLTAGFYTVRATRTSGLTPASGCASAPLKVEVKDERKFPIVTLTSTANTTCNTTFDASITLTATTAGIGAGANYSIVWNATPGAPASVANQASVASPYTTGAGDNIGVGIYTATATNLTTQCVSTASVTVIQNTTPVQIWDVTKVDQTDCAPFNGSIEIDSNDPTQVSVVGPYTFTWEKAGVALAPVPDNILTAVDAGVYTVTATKVSGIGAGCTTAPFSVTVLDLADKPAVDLSPQANFACDPALANGQISSIVLEGSATPPATDYSYQWFAGHNITTGPVIGNTATLVNQVQGDYTLQVVDNVSPNRGCIGTASTAIHFDKTTFSVAVSKTDQKLCTPLQDGSVSVTDITEVRNGTATTITDFSLFGFQWFDESGTAHPSTPTFVNGANAISNLPAGSYTVQVRNSLGCVSTATAGIVENVTVRPLITLENYLNPAVCILPETPGFLQVSADNSLNFGDYTFEWFEGPDVSGTVVEPNNPTLDNITYGQPREYTVRVTNIATNCANVDTYQFGVDTVEVQVLASAVARTSCLVDNGSLFATTLAGSGALYNYEWYAGASVSGTPLYTTKEVNGVPVGQYTVVAVNPSLAFCTSDPYTTLVEDGRVTPQVVAVQKNPLTYCDPANPNGVAFATVNDQVTGYTFDWFEGAVNGTPLYTGSEVSGLAAKSYVVRATDVITGCENTASIQIDNDPVQVPVPTVVVVSHLTNCVDPDGILSASVNGNTADYTLLWYNGKSVKKNNDSEGEYYRGLDKGSYTTTATDNQSGCVSAPVVTEILPFQELPDFEIATEPTNCEDDIGEAKLIPLNNVPLLSVEWNINGAAEFGTMLSGLPKGEFTVTATSYKECVATKTFEIEPEVLVFNGISRNNDGQNDIFEIACIQDYPHNNVKIFDRAGTLVYEANGYDNQDVFFDGVSNRGISLLGHQLPDGTYFYIIDKRDGSEPRTGYLEILSN